eukprot:s735_g15.t1
MYDSSQLISSVSAVCHMSTKMAEVGLWTGPMDEVHSPGEIASLVRLAEHLEGACEKDDSPELAEAMDFFIEAHSQRYVFRDTRYGAMDRYVQLFRRLQEELRQIMCSNHKEKKGRVFTLRILQCLRLLTRDPDFQLALLEKGWKKSAFEETELPLQSTQERGRELPTPVPPACYRVMAPDLPGLPPPSLRSGACASPRTMWRSPEPMKRSPSAEVLEEVVCRGPAYLADAQAERERFRLPPLEMRSCERSQKSALSSSRAPEVLRILPELVSEYLAEVEGGFGQGIQFYEASTGGIANRLAVTVAGLCVSEIAGMLNRYASTEDRRSRLAEMGALPSMARLLHRDCHPLVQRCALETAVQLTRSPGVLEQLEQASAQESFKVLFEVAGQVGYLVLRRRVAAFAAMSSNVGPPVAPGTVEIAGGPKLSRSEARRLREEEESAAVKSLAEAWRLGTKAKLVEAVDQEEEAKKNEARERSRSREKKETLDRLAKIAADKAAAKAKEAAEGEGEEPAPEKKLSKAEEAKLLLAKEKEKDDSSHST